MRIVKEANAGGGCPVSAEELGQINALARRELKAEEVYTFTVRLCDNEIDRDGERFGRKTLEGLAGMFVGKSGLFDHQWSARGQTARIFKTEVVREEGRLTRAGDESCYLKGWAYMLRTAANEELIAEIEGGIKREVSVGCAVEKAVCSICGRELGSCEHVKGRVYDGKLCWGELTGARDAYEWSFVAVPAQARAGVMKGLEPTLKELVRGRPGAAGELERLEKEAGLGRKYLEELRARVVKLAVMSWPEVDGAVVRSMAGKLDREELEALGRTLGRKVEEEWPLGVQLDYGGKERREEDGAFLV